MGKPKSSIPFGTPFKGFLTMKLCITTVRTYVPDNGWKTHKIYGVSCQDYLWSAVGDNVSRMETISVEYKDMNIHDVPSLAYVTSKLNKLIG